MLSSFYWSQNYPGFINYYRIKYDVYHELEIQCHMFYLLKAFDIFEMVLFLILGRELAHTEFIGDLSWTICVQDTILVTLGHIN